MPAQYNSASGDPIVDDNRFFRDATLRICGSIATEKAMGQTLRFVRRYMPADLIAFHVLNQEENILETIAMATLEKSAALSLRTTLSAGQRRYLDTVISNAVWIKRRWQENDITCLFSKTACHSSRGTIDHFPCPPCGSGMLFRLFLDENTTGFLDISSHKENQFNDEHARLIALLRKPFSIAFSSCLRYRQLLTLENRLPCEVQTWEKPEVELGGETIIGADTGLSRVMSLSRRVAAKKSPVLLLGETGVGKEILAGVIHTLSPRNAGPMVKVNCGALPATLMDNELFGHDKGAYTGATTDAIGRFERAHKGTLFLDEIGELTPEAQIRLLRVLQDQLVERVGGRKSIPVDVRVIAATHQDLTSMVNEGRFRKDLYFRLNVFPIWIPPLRERKEDIQALVEFFIKKKARTLCVKEPPPLTRRSIERLEGYDWPGNIRELENAVERELILSTGKPLRFDRLSVTARPSPAAAIGETMDRLSTLDDMNRAYIKRVLKLSHGKVEGRGGAADILGINPSTLRTRMRRLGIPFGRKSPGVRP
ncbi:MAG: sigma-54 dependent transcriptional regulator [Desulfobacterales bacterium]|jgi:transcriptional regulator with GAF, ATPase, and Fis domain